MRGEVVFCHSRHGIMTLMIVSLNYFWRILYSLVLCSLGLISNVIILFWRNWIKCLLMWSTIVSSQVLKLLFFLLVFWIILQWLLSSLACLKGKFLSSILIFRLIILSFNRHCRGLEGGSHWYTHIYLV